MSRSVSTERVTATVLWIMVALSELVLGLTWQGPEHKQDGMMSPNSWMVIFGAINTALLLAQLLFWQWRACATVIVLYLAVCDGFLLGGRLD